MRVEIGEPLQREEAEAKEDLPPVEGCGHSSGNFDPMAEWKARLAGKVRDEIVYTSPMPAVEAMPNWRGFAGWVEPAAKVPAAVEKPVVSAARKRATQETVVDAKVPEPTDLRQSVGGDLPSSLEPESSLDKTLKLGDIDELPPPPESEQTLNLDVGSMQLGEEPAIAPRSAADTVVRAKPASSPFSAPVELEGATDATLVVSLGEPEATLDEPPPRAPAPPAPQAIERSSPFAPVTPVGPQGDPTLVVSLDDAEPSLDEAAPPVVDASSPDEGDSPFAPVTPVGPQGDPTLVVSLDDAEPSLDEAAPPVVDAPSPDEGDSPFAPVTPVGPQGDPTLVVSIDDPEAVIDDPPTPPPVVQPAASAPKPGLSGKLAGVRPLAHPGRLPRGFDLSDSEKRVLRLCDGRRTTQAILDEDSAMDGAALTAFMKRCAKVKLVTFKR